MTIFTKWIKTGKPHDFVFLGKEIIATASGYHVIFYNLLTKEEKIEYFNSASRGEGACCLAGHQTMPIFSTAERRSCPNIYIHTFPEIRKISQCKLNVGPSSYLSCCFAGTEYLVSLTSYPDFQLIVWLWRTGEKLHSTETTLVDLNQIIEVSSHSSQLLYQFSPRSGKLWTHEIYTYSRKVTIVKNCITLNDKRITSVHWMNSGNLLLSDSSQNVHIVNVDGKKCQLILLRDFNVESKNVFLILPRNNTFFIIDHDSQLSCYSKSCLDNNEKWNLTWTTKIKPHPLKMVLARHKEAILMYAQTGEILELDLTRENMPNLENIYNDCQKIKYLSLLEPDKVNVVVVDLSNCLHVIDVFSGDTINNSIINQEDQVMCMVSHPRIPLITISTSTGKVMFFIQSKRNFINLKTIRLQKDSLEKLRFSRSGLSLGISSTQSKFLFILKTVVTEKIDVLLYTELKKFIIDFLIFENGQNIILLVLSQTVADVSVSDCFEVYSMQAGETAISGKRIILTNQFYKHLNYCEEKCGDFVSSPYLSKKIGFFQFEDNFQFISLFRMIDSTHKIRKFKVFFSTEYLLTSGFDGFIFLRSWSDPSVVIKTFIVHHYLERGTNCAVLPFNHDIVISLGNNGCLLCVSLSDTEELKKTLVFGQKSLVNYKEIENFERLHYDGNKLKVDAKFTWLEIERLKLAHAEMSKTLLLRNIVSEYLYSLKQKVKKLLDMNQKKNIECQIPISAFDLSSKIEKGKVDSSVFRQETEILRLQSVIAKKEEIVNYLIKECIDTYEVRDSYLTSFNSEIVIKNYKLWNMAKLEKPVDFFIELFDFPLLNKPVRCNNKTIEEKISKIITDGKNPNSINANNTLFSKFSNDAILSGSTMYKYISNNAPQNQLSIVDFYSINSQLSREHQLKVHFNNKFNKMKYLKTKVLDETEERLKQLNAYQKELQDIFGVIIENPYGDYSKWQLDDSLAVALNNSLSINQSISILNSNNQNTSRNSSNSIDHSTSTLSGHEQIFREEKLMGMMDGLLEIRLEDEIKKEIPKPYCMIFKPPSKHNDEDVQAIAIYKLKVEKLRIARKKYRAHLESQIHCINDNIKADIDHFDETVEEFFLEKIKIQSAILQEFLLRLNNHKKKFLKDLESKNISCIVNNDLASLENESKMLISEILKVEPVVIELRNKYDNLNKRDKVLETKFTSEFSNLKQPLVEHLLRQYKRRSKISQISCISLTCLTETNKCLVTGKKSAILPQEYLNFLRGMDSLDMMPSGLPPQIDGNHWQLLCKLRRNKVEMEIKLRIAALELTEAEQTYFHLQKISSLMQSKIYFIKNSVEEETLKQSKFYEDSDIQLILKAGQIEISLMGSIKDFDIAIVVMYDQMIQINIDIVKEGQKKIAAMQAAMFVRKSILYRQWKYQCMSTKLKHWQEQLSVLQNIKICKDMQNYLLERLEGNIRFKDATSSGKILSSIKKKFQRMLKEEQIMLRRIAREIRYWRKENVILTNRTQLYESLKQHKKFELEETHSQKRNRTFHKYYLRAIMERTNLVEKLKESRNELLNLQTQLELLKLKTYPTLRFKDICHS